MKLNINLLYHLKEIKTCIQKDLSMRLLGAFFKTAKNLETMQHE